MKLSVPSPIKKRLHKNFHINRTVEKYTSPTHSNCVSIRMKFDCICSSVAHTPGGNTRLRLKILKLHTRMSIHRQIVVEHPKIHTSESEIVAIVHTLMYVNQ